MIPIVKNRHTNARWQKAIDLCLAEKYPTDEQIEGLGISRATYFRWKQTPEFQEDCLKQSNQRFYSLTGRAVKKLEGLLESEDEHIAIKAAQMILDKTIEGAVEEKDNDTSIKMTVEYVDSTDRTTDAEYEVQ